MGYSFRDRAVLLTGATGGIGRVLARQLVEQGAKLVVTGRDLDSLHALIDSLPDPRAAVAIDGTLNEPGEAERLANAAPKVFGRIDVLINNAGLGYFALVEEASEESIREVFELNLFVPLVLSRGLLGGMKARGEGRIINIASAAGRVPIPTVGVYGGSKSALAIVANTMRIELKGSGVEVINIYPGTVDTAFEVNALSENQRRGLDSVGRAGRPVEQVVEEIVEAAKGPAREVWLERPGRLMAGAAILWPSWVERRLEPLRHRVLQHEAAVGKPRAERRWRLWQVEVSMACNLNCVMCPWRQIHEQTENRALVSDETWERIRPHLGEIAEIDFTGGGEPTLHPKLPDLVAEAASAGCRTGFLSNGMRLDEDLARRLIDSGIEWVTFSVDGADASTYEAIRPGADFERVTSNIRNLATIRSGRTPRIGINFVMMQTNAHQLEAIVELAAASGASFVNFKQCDVIRGELGRDHGLFRPESDAQIRRLERNLARAKKLAGRLGIETTSFSFTPDMQPVCEQDPRDSVFVRWDGSVAPCINQAYGGETCFLGKQAEMPTVLYGNLHDADALELWEGSTCGHYRTTFADREASYDREFQLELLGEGLSRISRAERAARAAMKSPPHGCDVCHYLYGI